VREDPEREGLLYAGTEFGLFISFDDGAHWQSFDRNMPAVPITDIKIHHKDLVVSTQGRSMWIMDDVTPLEQIGRQTAGSLALFKPRDAVRARIGGGRGGFGGGGGGGAAQTSGQAQFPPNGAPINYYLGRAVSGPLTIEIQDAAGHIVRSYSSEAATQVAGETPAAEVTSDDEAPAFRRAAPPVRLTTNAGMNRLTWDFNSTDGFMVPPGSYTVKVSASGWTDTEPLKLTMDPRLAADGITAADLKEQYDQNVRMRGMVAEVGRVATRVRQARTRLRSANSPDSLAKVEALATTLFGPDEGVRYGRPGLQTQITYLAGMTTRVDQRIGRDAVDRFQVLRKDLDGLEVRVNQVLGPDRSAKVVP
jgi:hypothetical protein